MSGLDDQHIKLPFESQVVPLNETRIDCNLLPSSSVAPLSALLVLLSAFFLYYFPRHNFLGSVWTWLFMSLLWMPIVINAATKLRIVISPEGISSKSNMHKDSLFKRTVRPWSDLHSVRLKRFTSAEPLFDRLKYRLGILDQPVPESRIWEMFGKGWFNQGFLVLDFTSGGSIPFPLAGFTAEALDDLFIGLSRFADPLCMNPDVIALARDVLSGTPLQLASNYRRMWESSLKQRFEATNFVPIEGGALLRNGTLKILMLLACGGQASVYLVADKSGHRLVVKELAAATNDPATRDKVHELFLREARLLAKLDHPNIALLLDHFVENDRDYLLLEYVPGLTFRQHVQMCGPLAESDVWRIAKSIAELVIYLHSQDPPVIHRDLTPDNFVIREPDRQVVLIDFGAASEFVGQVTGTMIGKQCYIPPEQFRGKATLQSDLYAVGATLFFLLTGDDPTPITQASPQAKLETVSTRMDEIVRQLTATELENRIDSANSFMDSLESRSRIEEKVHEL